MSKWVWIFRPWSVDQSPHQGRKAVGTKARFVAVGGPLQLVHITSVDVGGRYEDF